MASSFDHNEMLHSVRTALGLHCLLGCHLGHDSYYRAIYCKNVRKLRKEKKERQNQLIDHEFMHFEGVAL